MIEISSGVRVIVELQAISLIFLFVVINTEPEGVADFHGPIVSARYFAWKALTAATVLVSNMPVISTLRFSTFFKNVWSFVTSPLLLFAFACIKVVMSGHEFKDRAVVVEAVVEANIVGTIVPLDPEDPPPSDTFGVSGAGGVESVVEAVVVEVVVVVPISSPFEPEPFGTSVVPPSVSFVPPLFGTSVELASALLSPPVFGMIAVSSVVVGPRVGTKLSGLVVSAKTIGAKAEAVMPIIETVIIFEIIFIFFVARLLFIVES